jgi:hypothetical protein
MWRKELGEVGYLLGIRQVLNGRVAEVVEVVSVTGMYGGGWLHGIRDRGHCPEGCGPRRRT